MTNKAFANLFRELAKIMELHGENPFKIRSYQNAYINLRKLDQPVIDMDITELAAIKGIGKAISSKIREVSDTGKMETLEKYRLITPVGVREMLNISGFGPKKIRTIWKDLHVETIGELLYAVNENRLIELKGFGAKTQEDLKVKLAYLQLSKGQFLYARAEQDAYEVIEQLVGNFPTARIEFTGDFRRRCPTLANISILIAGAEAEPIKELMNGTFTEGANNVINALSSNGYPVTIYVCGKAEWGSKQFRYTASTAFMTAFIEVFPGVDFKQIEEEKSIFEKMKTDFLPAELREDSWGLSLAQSKKVPILIEENQIKGVIHTHTTYSDGVNSIEEMVSYADELGYEYIGITDHSKAAFYAGGLKEEAVLEQMAVIDALNEKQTKIRVLKGIESDILADGSLDYEEDILKQFDFIIASIHSNLRMDEQKATRRLIKAIENPYTSILGHPTGRLLLSRPGYPIDHQKIIDACAANQVAIELNANPLRLDLDWSWIPVALEKGVFISINPDAHSCKGIHDIHYGVLAARKGGLAENQCLNALNVELFMGKVHKWS